MRFGKKEASELCLYIREAERQAKRDHDRWGEQQQQLREDRS